MQLIYFHFCWFTLQEKGMQWNAFLFVLTKRHEFWLEEMKLSIEIVGSLLKQGL